MPKLVFVLMAEWSWLREREQNYASLSQMLARFYNVLSTHCFPSENIPFLLVPEIHLIYAITG